MIAASPLSRQRLNRAAAKPGASSPRLARCRAFRSAPAKHRFSHLHEENSWAGLRGVRMPVLLRPDRFDKRLDGSAGKENAGAGR
jgi:hypothetical protein